MSILKFILFFTTLTFLSLPSFAMESKILSTTLNETVSISKSGCTKSMVQKPYFASVKIEGGKINIEAKNIGSSYIYLWFGEEMEVYNLKVDLPKEVKPKTRA